MKLIISGLLRDRPLVRLQSGTPYKTRGWHRHGANPLLVFGPGRRSADGGCVGSPPQPNLPELTCQPHGVALLNLLFGSGGTWLDPFAAPAGAGAHHLGRASPAVVRHQQRGDRQQIIALPHHRGMATREGRSARLALFLFIHLQRSVGCLLLRGGTSPPGWRC